MGDKHVHGEVKDLSVQTEVGSDALVQGPVPLFDVHFLRCVEADSIAPKVRDVANLEFEFVDCSISSHKMRVFDELEEELIEVSLDVDTLQFRIIVLADQDVIGVDLEAAILASDYSNVVALSRLAIRLDNVLILDQRRGGQG